MNENSINLLPGDIVKTPDGEPSRYGYRFGVVMSSSSAFRAVVSWRWETSDQIGIVGDAGVFEPAQFEGESWRAGGPRAAFRVRIVRHMFGNEQARIANYITPEPSALDSALKSNFRMLERAFINNDVCLIAARDNRTGESVALICALNPVGFSGDVQLVPFAALPNENPFERYTLPA